MLQGIVFDMDGILFDTERLALESWLHTGKLLNLNITEEIARKTIGYNAEITWKILKNEVGDFDQKKARSFRSEYISSYIHENGVPQKKGLFEILEFLSESQIRLAVATSTARKNAEFYLKNTGIFSFFDSILCSDQIEKPKPAPDIYLKSCKQLDVNPAFCFAIEDSYAGITAAYQAKMKPVMIPDILPPNNAMHEMAYTILPDLLALKEFINCEISKP